MPTDINRTNSIPSVLSVSPMQEDHHYLQRILRESALSFYTCGTLRDAAALLRQNPIPVVICEDQLPPYTWRDLLTEITSLPHAPLLIVASRLADDHLWAEALNLGAQDVLAKPFDAEEVRRVVGSAARQWRPARVCTAGAV